MSEHQHIVPRGYLRNFAVDDRIGMLLVDSGEARFPGVADAGVRSNIYTRARPSGERSFDIEGVSLASAEDGGLPIIREIRQRWPLSGDEKVAAATFLGIQLVRGPRWFDWHTAYTASTIDDFHGRGMFREGSIKHGVSEETIKRAYIDHEDQGTVKLLTMIRIGAKAGSILGSLHWSLLTFGTDVLGTGDHPVTVWPVAEKVRWPAPLAVGTVGALNLLEVRFPIDPRTALLLTWQDRPDDAKPISCAARHAWNINSFTRAEAEKQWFFRPETKPRTRSGSWLPLAPELFLGYGPRSVESSQMRRLIAGDLNRRRSGLSAREIDGKCEIRYLPQPTAIAAA